MRRVTDTMTSPARRAAVSSNANLLDLAATPVGLAPFFQPIVTLPGETVVGFEALARWPSLQNPDPQAVFERAKATGRLDQLDQHCIDCAIETALAHNLAPDTLLMLNCEPTSAYVPKAKDPALARALDHLRVTFELTERSLLRSPKALLRKVAALREDGFAVALDDVGAHPDSLALLDVISPDVIKLDLHLVQSQPGDEQARILAAVLAHKERTGATLIAEGIESDEHLEQALALGADMGQGYKFGRPAPLERQFAVAWSPPPRRNPPASDLRSPFDIAARMSSLRTARRATLIAFTQQIEAQAWHSADPPIVLTALQRAENFTAETVVDRYRDLAKVSPLVAVFGRGMTSETEAGVRGVDLDPADPLCDEWTVVVLGPHHAAALIARERLGAPRADLQRRFDFTVTYDRALVTLAARNLLDRII